MWRGSKGGRRRGAGKQWCRCDDEDDDDEDEEEEEGYVADDVRY